MLLLVLLAPPVSAAWPLDRLVSLSGLSLVVAHPGPALLLYRLLLHLMQVVHLSCQPSLLIDNVTRVYFCFAFLSKQLGHLNLELECNNTIPNTTLKALQKVSPPRVALLAGLSQKILIDLGLFLPDPFLAYLCA